MHHPQVTPVEPVRHPVSVGTGAGARALAATWWPYPPWQWLTRHTVPGMTLLVKQRSLCVSVCVHTGKLPSQRQSVLSEGWSHRHLCAGAVRVDETADGLAAVVARRGLNSLRGRRDCPGWDPAAESQSRGESDDLGDPLHSWVARSKYFIAGQGVSLGPLDTGSSSTHVACGPRPHIPTPKLPDMVNTRLSNHEVFDSSDTRLQKLF